MAKDDRLLYVSPGAEKDAEAFDEEGRLLWARAKERLQNKPAPDYGNDKRLAGDGPPVQFLTQLGSTSAIIIQFLYLPNDKGVWIIGVDAYPRQDERPSR